MLPKQHQEDVPKDAHTEFVEKVAKAQGKEGGEIEKTVSGFFFFRVFFFLFFKNFLNFSNSGYPSQSGLGEGEKAKIGPGSGKGHFPFLSLFFADFKKNNSKFIINYKKQTGTAYVEEARPEELKTSGLEQPKKTE